DSELAGLAKGRAHQRIVADDRPAILNERLIRRRREDKIAGRIEGESLAVYIQKSDLASDGDEWVTDPANEDVVRNVRIVDTRELIRFEAAHVREMVAVAERERVCVRIFKVDRKVAAPIGEIAAVRRRSESYI